MLKRKNKKEYNEFIIYMIFDKISLNIIRIIGIFIIYIFL